MFTMDDLFEIAIKMEENGEAVYKDAIKKIKPNDLKTMLQWMADEEASHCKWFKGQKNSLSLKIDEADLKKMVPQVLKDMMGEKTLCLDDINFSEMTKISQLLDTFIKFENDTIMFYELLEMFIEEEKILNGLKEIIREEKNHIQKLKTIMSSLSDKPI